MSFTKELLISLPNIFTTFLFGFARFLMMSQLDYQGHASEWGTHWNFYTTITICILAGIFLRDSKNAIFYAFTVMLAYQYYCNQNNFSEYMFHAPRNDFISGNREGLYSLVGYISLQFIGFGLGRFILSSVVDPEMTETLSTGGQLKEDCIMKKDLT